MSELTNLEKMRGLRWQLVGNAFNTIFWVTAAAGSVVILFFNELGLDKVRIGFLVSLLPFCGLTAVLTAPFMERFGFKRMFLLFYGLRKFFIAFLLLTPFIPRQFIFLWVAAVVFLFALCRAFAETAIYPWSQEMIPDSIRGKFSATVNILCQSLNIAAVAGAGYIIGKYDGIGKFMAIIACGIAAGLVSLWCFGFVPGGKPKHSATRHTAHFQGMLTSLRDTNYLRFMTGLCVLSMAVSAIVAFMPLYMKEQVGLSSGMVVWLDMGMFAGGMLSSFLWGWASDRYGSKPIMLFGACLFLLYPLLCFLIPRHSDKNAAMAMVITFLMGVANLAWAIGFARYLFVSAVPADKKTAYMAVFYACVGLAAGTGPLLAGALLKSCVGISGSFWIFTFDQYTPLFGLGFAAIAVSVFVLSKVRSDGAMPVRKFVGMFLQGNPLTAAAMIFRYYRAADEDARVSIAEQMGYANNPLSNNELIAALNDPSFNVRYEAIVAVAHRRPDPELVDALLLVLGSNEPDLSIHAAWALGRLGDRHAAIALRETLESEHPLLRARSARALATLGDTHSIERLLHYFRTETNPGLRIAYAQGLGKMGTAVAIEEMLDFLATLGDRTLRAEMALAIGRIAGGEKEYISLLREFDSDQNTAAAQALLAIKRSPTALPADGADIAKLAQHCSKVFAAGDATCGIRLLIKLIAGVSMEKIDRPLAAILAECSRRLAQFGTARSEYLLLSLHTLERALKQPHGSGDEHRPPQGTAAS